MFHNGNRAIALLAVCGSICAISIAIIAYSVNHQVSARDQEAQDQARINFQVCKAFNKFDLVIVATLKRSRENLPKLTYFKDHPDELANQLRSVNRQIDQFGPKPC